MVCHQCGYEAVSKLCTVFVPSEDKTHISGPIKNNLGNLVPKEQCYPKLPSNAQIYGWKTQYIF